MPKTSQVQESQSDAQEWAGLKKKITDFVLKKLGRPPRLLDVDVIKVSEHAYRVNVIVNDASRAEILDILCRRIAHSYFVKEQNTNSLVSDPPVIRTY